MASLNLTESIRISNKIIPQLFLCASKDDIENTFASEKITSIPDKIGLLQLCMGVKNFSNSPPDKELTIEQQYEDVLLIFMEGSWRFLI